MQLMDVLRKSEKEAPIKADERYTGQEKEGERKKRGSIPKLNNIVPTK